MAGWESSTRGEGQGDGCAVSVGSVGEFGALGECGESVGRGHSIGEMAGRLRVHGQSQDAGRGTVGECADRGAESRDGDGSEWSRKLEWSGVK